VTSENELNCVRSTGVRSPLSAAVRTRLRKNL